MSDRTTTDRGWVSVNTSGCKVRVSMFSTVIGCIGSGYQLFGEQKINTPAHESFLNADLKIYKITLKSLVLKGLKLNAKKNITTTTHRYHYHRQLHYNARYL